jgi:NAD(P)-dependent dehydrogenase (short-subunit alcohol dehydrogenase family)
MTSRALVFGASGTLGAATSMALAASGVAVTQVTRRSSPVPDGWVSTSGEDWCRDLNPLGYDRIVFAQGLNSAGGLEDEAVSKLNDLFDANVLSIVKWLHDLRESGRLQKPARVCIIGSIWATAARPDKLAYVVSKSAVTGLVRALTADLAGEGIVVNAVLPGVVDSPMTRAFVSEQSLNRLMEETPTRVLATPADVARACEWLTSPLSSGICGQSIVLDNGWSVVRHV